MPGEIRIRAENNIFDRPFCLNCALSRRESISFEGTVVRHSFAIRVMAEGGGIADDLRPRYCHPRRDRSGKTFTVRRLVEEWLMTGRRGHR